MYLKSLSSDFPNPGNNHLAVCLVLCHQPSYQGNHNLEVRKLKFYQEAKVLFHRFVFGTLFVFAAYPLLTLIGPVGNEVLGRQFLEETDLVGSDITEYI